MFPDWTALLKREAAGYESALDLACGYNSQIGCVDIPYKVGVEMFPAYLEESKKKNIHDEYIEGNILLMEFPSKSYDLVFCSEVIEHLEKDDGVKLLDNAEKWACKKVIITTPNGFLQQDEYDNNPLQIHKSGWTALEFQKRGYAVYGIGGLKVLKKEHGVLRYRPYFLWRVISDMTQLAVYFFPRFAFQLFAVKNFENNEQ